MNNNSLNDYLNSQEYLDLLDQIELSNSEYKIKAKEFFDNLSYDDQLLVFSHVIATLYQGQIIDKGSYRHILYNSFGFDKDSYALGMDCGLLELHNSIYSREELLNGVKAILNLLNFEATPELLNKAIACINYGYVPKQVSLVQLKFQFDN